MITKQQRVDLKRQLKEIDAAQEPLIKERRRNVERAALARFAERLRAEAGE